MTRIFPARYDGRCPECYEVIHEGDLLRPDADDRVVHADCDEHASPYRKPPEICPRCFIAKAANGSCGCDS